MDNLDSKLTALKQRTEQARHLNALVTSDWEGAAQRAAHLAERRSQGQWNGLLDGLVLAIKDNIETAGITTTSGSDFFRTHVPNHDAPVVERLKAAGALIAHKSALHEFAFGIRTTSPVSGQTLNPWNNERIPGGSSGGSAAAVAAGLCDAAIGTDTGGSVRLPAAMCGITGLRPTVGAVSNRGSTPVCPSQDTVGPMARSAMDVARLFATIVGFDSADPFSVDRKCEHFLPTLDAGVKGVTIGICERHYFEGIEYDIGQALDQSIKIFESLGATIVPVDLTGADTTHEAATTIIYSDACAFHTRRLTEEPERFDAQVLERMQRGFDFSSLDYSRAMSERMRWQRKLKTTFDQVDLLLSPTVHTYTPLVDDAKSLHAATRDATRNTYAGAFGQIPGLSIPCGMTRDGMPVGLQLEAPWWHEPNLLRAGVAFQQHTDWHLRRADDGAK